LSSSARTLSIPTSCEYLPLTGLKALMASRLTSRFNGEVELHPGLLFASKKVSMEACERFYSLNVFINPQDRVPNDLDESPMVFWWVESLFHKKKP
jgi:hypothetical protein